MVSYEYSPTSFKNLSSDPVRSKAVPLILNALQMALDQQTIGVHENIAHSDRGSQYASDEYSKKLKLAGVIVSMSRSAVAMVSVLCYFVL